MKVRRILKSYDGLALACLGGWSFIYHWSVTLGQQVFSAGDILWLFLPLRTELSRALREGRLPLWTPALHAGFPLFAEGEIGALYPLNVILHFLFPPAQALSYTILFNYAFAAVGMYLLVRSLGMGVASAFLAGWVFSAGGFFTAHLFHAPHLAVAAWLPWLIFFQRKLFVTSSQPETLRWFLISSLAIALFLLAGFPQFALFNIGMFNLCALLSPFIWEYRHASGATFWRSVRSVLMSLGATLLGVGLASVQLIPTFELIGLSIRGQDMGKAFFTSYSLAPAALAQFFAPFHSLGMPEAANMEYWAYIGICPVVLTSVAIFLRQDALTRFLLILVLAVLLLALGGNTPIYEWLYDLPLFNRFRVPARFLLLFTFAVAILSAIGLNELQHRARPDAASKWVWLLSIMLSAILPLGMLLYVTYDQPIEYWLALWKWLPILLGMGTLIALTLVKRLPRGVWVSIILGGAIFDLIAFMSVFRFTISRTSSPMDLTQVSRTVQTMDSQNPLYRSYYIKPPMTEAAIRGILFTNLPLLYDKQGLNNYLPSLAIRRSQKYIDEMSLGMRNLIGMRYYLLPLDIPPFGEPLPPWWDEFEPDGGLTPEVLSAQHAIAPTRVAQIEIVSYTDQTIYLPNGHLVGEITLGVGNGQPVTLPIRLGIETADWAYDSATPVAHDKPAKQLTFPAYLKSIGRTFEGRKYIARYRLAQNDASLTITSVGARSFLPVGGLNIERVLLIDDTGQTVSLAKLWYRNDLALVFRSHAVAMWENYDVLPRAFIVHRAEIVNGDAALERLKAPDFPFRELVLLSDVPDLALINAPTDHAQDQAIVIEYKPERVVVRVQTTSAGYLFLADTWYPGWIAWVDGVETPIYRADYIFRAVPLSAGQHTVVFEYRPVSLRMGALVSGFSLLILVGLAIYAWRMRTSQ